MNRKAFLGLYCGHGVTFNFDRSNSIAFWLSVTLYVRQPLAHRFVPGLPDSSLARTIYPDLCR